MYIYIYVYFYILFIYFFLYLLSIYHHLWAFNVIIFPSESIFLGQSKVTSRAPLGATCAMPGPLGDLFRGDADVLPQSDPQSSGAGAAELGRESPGHRARAGPWQIMLYNFGTYNNILNHIIDIYIYYYIIYRYYIIYMNSII